MDMQKFLRRQAGRLLLLLRAGGYKVAFAESCTGGLLAASLTACPGASQVFEQGFVTYSDQAKQQLLGVPADLLAEYTAVSAPVAAAMAKGAAGRSGADLAMAVTGWAGPGGFAEDWPVGLVYVAADWQGQVAVWRYQFPGGRRLVQSQTALCALQQGIKLLQK